MAEPNKKDEGKEPLAIPDPSKSTLAYLQHLQARIQPLTHSAAQIPNPSDLNFHKSLDKGLTKDLAQAKEEIVSTIKSLLACIDSTLSTSSSDQSSLDSDDLIEPNTFERKLGDVIDTLLERTDTRLDEYQGIIPVQKHSSASTSRNGTSRVAQVSTAGSTIPTLGPLPQHILNAPIKPLPQSKFTKKPDNSRENVWRHFLLEKPHAKVPLTWVAPSLQGENGIEGAEKSGIRQGMYCAEGDPRLNPYYFEINDFKPPSHALETLKMDDIVAPPPLQADKPDGGPIPFTWVDNENTFEKLYSHLMEDRVKEVAVDVEHHNFRSYQGLVCLVQISTRWKDFIIDALSPVVRQISTKLNDIFTDPAKVKILHGAEHDILWLQRDLGLYIVGLFDTFHATNVLNFPQHGLAYLLQRYIDFVADKRYQRADWRIRPLPKEMLYYARSDTHTLIHIYDCLRFEIEKQQGQQSILDVFENSKKTARKTYAKEQWNDSLDGREGWRNMWRQLGGVEALNTDSRWENEGGVEGLTQTERLFRALHNWRDQVARLEDENPKFILGSNNLLNLASRAPQTPESVLACVGPSFKKRVPDLLNLISSEIVAFERVQEKKIKRQQELLEKVASGEGLNDEEMGEVIQRSTIPKSLETSAVLWPTTTASSQTVSQDKSSATSKLASMLFKTQKAKGISSNLKRSLFAPASKTESKEQLLQGIRSDLSSALRGLLRVGQSTPSEGSESEEDNDEMLQDEPGIPATSSLAAHTEDAIEPSSPEVEEENPVLKNIRKSKDKKRNKKEMKPEHNDTIVSEKSTEEDINQKKRKLSKTEKAERKRQQKESLTNFESFDYSKATSILDSKLTKPSPKSAPKEKNRKKEEEGKSSKSPQKNARQGRYSNVPVSRDRREQMGGKSMTFSR